MTSRLPFLFALILVACSGSSAGVDLFTPPSGEPTKGEPTKFVTMQSDEAGLTSKLVNPQEDAGTALEASTDSGQDASQDAEQDASQVDSGEQDADANVDADVDVSRYGVSFHGAYEEGLAAPLSTDLIGQASITAEAYFRLDAVTDRGLIFQTPYAYCAVTTTGPTTGSIHCCAPLNNTNPCAEGPAKANPGVWYHIAWVLSASTWTLYVNGQKQSDVPSAFQTYPAFVAPTTVPLRGNHVFFGISAFKQGDHSVVGTVDEFRLSYSALYTTNFTPPKHLDAPGALNLLLDDGVGTTSGSANLYGAASWVAVSR